MKCRRKRTRANTRYCPVLIPASMRSATSPSPPTPAAADDPAAAPSAAEAAADAAVTAAALRARVAALQELLRAVLRLVVEEPRSEQIRKECHALLSGGPPCRLES